MTAKIYNLVNNEVAIHENVVSVESLPSDKNAIILTFSGGGYISVDLKGKKQFFIS